ncbi:MAG: hypothetical protein WCG27_01175 [Pseudomonadota bacterium]
MREFESFLERTNQDLFGFAYILVPDPLQAEQVVIDALSLMSVEKSDWRSEWNSRESPPTPQDPLSMAVRKYLYQQVYRIGKKRSFQLHGSLQEDDRYTSYNSLPASERGILFLKYKTTFSLDEIAEIVAIDQASMLAILQIARKNILELLGKNFEVTF